MPVINSYNSVTIADNIKLLAREKDIQLKDMLDVLGLSRNTLSNLPVWAYDCH